MAQTTGAVSPANGKVEFSANGSSWTNISGSTSSVEPGDQTGQTGEAYSLEGDYAVITSGKKEPIELTVKIIYTETGGESFEVVRAVWETAARTGYIRFSPKGGNTGDVLYTSDVGKLSAFTYPHTTADDAKPIMAGFKIRVPKLTRSVLP